MAWAALILTLLLFVASPGRAATIHVPGDQPTIQAGIDAAVAGDTVVLAPGTYTDVVVRNLAGVIARSVAFMKSGVVLQSSDGAEVTFIDGELDHHCLVGEFLNSSTEVRGISFVNGVSLGSGGWDWLGGGVLVYDAGPLFERNVFRDCSAVGGGGFFSRFDFGGVGPTIRDNVFIDNEAEDLGGGLEIYLVDSFLVEGNTFVRNHCYKQGGGGLLLNGSIGVVNRNIFWRNTAAGGAGGVSGISAGSNVTGSCNVFWENVGGFAPHVDGVFIVIGAEGNVIVDPLFCDPDNGDFTIQSDSPCAPPGVTGCGLVGALPVGCGPVSVVEESWAVIKGKYR